ncbi:MAG: NAD(P)H-dependent oxidoreductase subunit E [Deltaproteobacteria bacterium]|nr:NAD(P)H-dependent oxidoreductase subunit E [Deltaproteobacteria bacterium]
MRLPLEAIIEQYNADPTRLMDILLDIQSSKGQINKNTIDIIARKLKISVVDVEQTVSFYHFFSTASRGYYTVYLNNSAVATMMGSDIIARTFENEAQCKFGEVSEDGLIGLFETSCIGMNDQEPAAIINNIVFPNLTTRSVKKLIGGMRQKKKLRDLQLLIYGDAIKTPNRFKKLATVVKNNIRKKGPVIFGDYNEGEMIEKMLTLTPEQVINIIKESGIRGRGGAGFPTGLKWEFCRNSPSNKRYIFCNADEGEPGTFKDRVILTELPRLVFEGMVLGGYAIGSDEGILYLRYEYRYMKDYLEDILKNMRKKKLLGENICGKAGFNFDIRVQFGAGSYVCGEESALIESAEGKRGEPRDRPPFPANRGYLDQPTVINNVETLCAATKIITNGAEWFRSIGTSQSPGTKVLSISGDCAYPGVYEIICGCTVHEILEMAGAEKVQAVLIGGPSGTFIGPDKFYRWIAFEDLSTGGSFIIFNQTRDILKDAVLNFTDFFIEESCGSCAPCRFMTVLLKQKLEKIINGKGVARDLVDLEQWSSIMPANRCGLGQTAANPIKTTLANLRHLYTGLINTDSDFISEFDLKAAVAASCAAVNRKPMLHGV